ncbi:MAG TPA: two-component regulator propeller domain-containing protein [Cyclobacteriaceae bacterium]
MLRLCILFLLFPAAVLHAQENIRLEQFGVKDGLSQGDIKCFVQDDDGFLWIGTRDGLNKYDGNKFTQYGRRFNDSTSLYFNQILDLKLDQRGNIWIASVGGISCYDRATETFQNYLLPGESASTTRVNSLFIDEAETVVLSTNEGLIRFNTVQKTFAADPEYFDAANAGIVQFHSDPGIGTWIATEKGLHVKPAGSDDWKILFNGDNVANLNIADKKVFISTSRGLFVYDLTDDTSKQIILPFESQFAHQSLVTGTGELWVARDRIVVIDPKSYSVKHVISREEGLTEDRAKVLFQSRDGVIWIGTFGYGLNKHDPYTKKFRYLGVKSSIPLSSNYVSTIQTTDDNTILIGTTRGLNVVDLTKRATQYHFRNDNMFLVHKIKQGSRGITWIATSKGLQKYDQGKFMKANFAYGEIPDFVEWDANTMLVATRLFGLHLVNKDDNGVRELASPKIVKEVSTVYARKNLIWVGSQDGLRLLSKDGQLVKHFKSEGSRMSMLHSNIIKCIVEDSKNNLWIGTWGGGLSRYNDADSTFTTFDQSHGLPNNTVYGVVEDNKGFLWLSTNMGISRFDPRENTFKNFDFESGLQGNEFNTGAYFKSPNNVIYLGGTDGLTYFHPDSVLYDAPPASVVVTEVSIDNLPLSKTLYSNSINSEDNLELTWNRANVGIGFTSIDYRNADKTTFQFTMNDDTTWSDIENRRNLELVNLPAGKHVLHIRAKRSGEPWGQPTTLSMYVHPAFWRTTSFIIFVGALVLICAYGLYRVRINYLKRLNLRLQKLVDDRTREIQLKNEEISAQNEELTSSSEKLAMLNDELEQKIDERTQNIQQLNTDLQEQNKQLEQFSFITAHNFRGPLARIKGLISLIGPEPKENLGQILSYLKLSADNLDEVIQDLNKILEIKKEGERQSETIQLLPELKLALSLVEEDLFLKNIKIDLSEFVPQSIKGHKSYVQSIFSNLLANAVKYADSTKTSFIKIICVVEDGRLKIEFADNGVGFDLDLAAAKLFMPYQRFNESHSGKGLGLYIVKTQVNLMKGEISVESKPGVGSTFRIYFPL